MYRLLINSQIPVSLKEEFAKEFELIIPPGDADFTDDEMQELVKSADAMLCLKLRKVHNTWIDAGTRLRVIGNVAVGTDNINVAYAASKGIAVVNTPISVQEPTAELAISIMLAITRGIARYHTELKKTLRCGMPFFYDRDMSVYGKTLGIIGCGRIGKAVARKAQGLGMRVVYYKTNRLTQEEEAALNLTYLPFEELLKTSDVVSLHLPFTPASHHLINDRTLALMMPGAYLINAARGPIVDEAALIRALNNKTIRGAALDVYEFEPVVSEEFTQMDNVVIVPHIGTTVLEARCDMAREALSGIREVLNGNTPSNIVKLS